MPSFHAYAFCPTALPTSTSTSSSSSTFLSTPLTARPILLAPLPPPRRLRRLRLRRPPTALLYPSPVATSASLTALSRSASSIPDVFASVAAVEGDRVAVVDEHHGGTTYTYASLVEATAVFSAGLRRLGLAAGARTALFAENSSRWLIADQAILRAGASAAVRGVDAPVRELLYIFDHSRSAALVVEDFATLEKVVAGGFDVARAAFVVVLYGEGGEVGGRAVLTFEDVMARGVAPSGAEREVLATRADVATVLYTSGTTGLPKGVPLTHGNIMAQLDRICVGSIDPVPGDVFVSVLPCWHIFERTAAYYCFSKALKVVYSNKRHFRDDLAKHRPHVLIAVPRVFENLYNAILSKLSKAKATQKRVATFFIAVSIAFIHVQRTVQGLSLRRPRKSLNFFHKAFLALQYLALAPLYALAKMLVWKKILSATGGRVKLCVCGGGSVPDYLEDFFQAAGLELCVGYGLTETSPIISNRCAEHNVRGSAGLPLPDTILKIVDQATRQQVPQGVSGELMVSGPQVFSGYLDNPEATDKAFDNAGFFDTGDLAYISDAGDVVITGRSKDTIVLSSGENIEPIPIEDAVLSSPLIDQIMIVGQDQKALCALVVPSLPGLDAEGLLDADTKERIAALGAPGHEQALRHLGQNLVDEKSPMAAAIFAAIAAGNKARPNFESRDRIRRMRLVLEPFSVENGMLTQTLKVKRNVVTANYQVEIDALFH